jgi:tetratricopeptide (TPR) repeat protein
VFTRKRLVRALSQRADEQQHVSFLERAQAERGENEARGRVALGAYLAARLIDRLLGSTASADDEDAIRWQYQTTREYLTDLPTDDAEANCVSRIIDAAAGPIDVRLGRVREALHSYSAFLEREDRAGEALDILRLAAASSRGAIHPAEFCELALSAGRLNLALGRPEQAADAFLAAEEAAREAADESALLRARLGEPGIARLRGDLARARAAVEHVISEASTHPGLDTVAGDAYAELGAVLQCSGQPIDALRAMYEAFARTPGCDERMSILCRLGEGLAGMGEADAAQAAFDLVEASVISTGIRVRALLGSMDVASSLGNRLAFERARAEARAVIGRLSAEARINFLHQSAVGLARFDQRGRAAAAWREALALAQAHRLAGWERTIERITAHLGECGPAAAPDAPGGDPAPDLAILSADLRHLAALAAR